MHRKLITACMALAAFAALIMPAIASATSNPTLTEGGNHVPAGAIILTTNTTPFEFTNTGGTSTQVSCTSAVMTGEVIKNSGGTVEVTITTSDLSGTGSVHTDNNLKECTASFGNAYITVTGHQCIRSTPTMATHEFQVHKGTCGSTQEKVEFVIGSTTFGACEYRATGIIIGHYTTGVGTTLTVTPNSNESGATKISGSFFCPHSGALDMAVDIETVDGTQITVP